MCHFALSCPFLSFLTIILLVRSPLLHAQAFPVAEGTQEPPVVGVITAEGHIQYYAMPLADPGTAQEIKWSFHNAARENVGMAEYMQKHPDLSVIVGTPGAFYTMPSEQIEKGTFEPIQVPTPALAPAYQVGFQESFVKLLGGVMTDPRAFLGNLAKDMLEHARTISCSAPVVPETVQASASIGVISFSATWSTATLCRE